MKNLEFGIWNSSSRRRSRILTSKFLILDSERRASEISAREPFQPAEAQEVEHAARRRTSSARPIALHARHLCGAFAARRRGASHRGRGRPRRFRERRRRGSRRRDLERTREEWRGRGQQRRRRCRGGDGAPAVHRLADADQQQAGGHARDRRGVGPRRRLRRRRDDDRRRRNRLQIELRIRLAKRPPQLGCLRLPPSIGDGERREPARRVATPEHAHHGVLARAALEARERARQILDRIERRRVHVEPGFRAWRSCASPTDQAARRG